MSESPLPGFTIGNELSFGFNNAVASVNRRDKDAPIHFNLAAKFFGMDNLDVDLAFEISPFSNFSAFIYYSTGGIIIKCILFRFFS
jgi:hypothetical protein